MELGSDSLTFDAALEILRTAFVPARPRSAESRAALASVRDLRDVMPTLEAAGLLPASLASAGIGFGVVCDACGGRGGRVGRTRSGTADEACAKCRRKGFTSISERPTSLELGRMLGAGGEAIAAAVEIARGLSPRLAELWGYGPVERVVLRWATHASHLHLPAGNVVHPHWSSADAPNGLELCTRLGLPRPGDGATDRTDMLTQLAYVAGIMLRGRAEQEIHGTMSPPLFEAAKLGHPIDGYATDDRLIVVCVPAPTLRDR